MAEIAPEIYAQSVCWWIKNNRWKFRRIMYLVHREVDRGRQVQRGDIYKLAKDARMPISVCDDLKRDNNLWPGISRYMVMLSPRLARAIRFRKSGLDEIDLISIWRENDNAGTTFLALDRFEAQEFCKAKDACSL